MCGNSTPIVDHAAHGAPLMACHPNPEITCRPVLARVRQIAPARKLTLFHAGISWYRPQTMFPLGKRSPQTLFPLAACLLLAAGPGCGGNALWLRGQDGPLEQVQAAELRPGCYCEIEMVVPPMAPEGSLHCFNGTVKEINDDEIVLAGVLEQSNIDYGLKSRKRPLTQQKRDLVHVPLLGVREIWALPPGKGSAAAKPSSMPAATPLISGGSEPHAEAPARVDPPATGDAKR